MNLPTLPTILSGAVVLASLGLVWFYQSSESETSSLSKSPWMILEDLQRNDPEPNPSQTNSLQPNPSQPSLPRSNGIAVPDSGQLTFTPLPPIDSGMEVPHEIEPVDSPEFVQQVAYLSPAENPLTTSKTLEPASHTPEPLVIERLPAWEVEPQKDERSIGTSQNAQTRAQFDATVAGYNFELDDDLKEDNEFTAIESHNESESAETFDATVAGYNFQLDGELGEEDLSEEDLEFSIIDSIDEPEPFEPGPTEEYLDQLENQFNSVDDAPELLVDNSAFETEVLFERIRNSRVTAAAHEIRWSLNDAIMASLIYSNRISSLRIESIEELQNVGVESGQFDVVGFIDQSFRNSSEPVGSSIDTASGTQPVIQEEDLNIAYGLRKQLRSGGEVELNHSFQVRDNDSGILVPEDQAFSRTNARLTKELLRGAGRSIALNEVLVAYHDASAQRAESMSESANHLNDVMTAYWDIFAARGALFASIENRQLAIEVLNELESRKEIDAERNLLDQARATIGQRELSINDAHNDLIQAQIRLVSLVNAPELLANLNSIEILPQVMPDLQSHMLDTGSRINTAIQRRPEIADLIEQIKSAQVTDHLSLNELLPRLSASIEASLNGLAGDRQTGLAIENQFDNDVTYQVGFNFEVPFTNRQARHTKLRTELAVRRLRADWQNMIEEVKADVLNNAQQFSATQVRLEKQRDILRFSGSELRYLGIRKSIAPKAESNPSFALTQVLAAQDRQGAAKSQFIAAIADKHRALFELNRATGILINSDVIPQDSGPGRSCLFSVYHQYIEDAAQFACPATELEAASRDQARQVRCDRCPPTQRCSCLGVKQLILPVVDQSPVLETPIECIECSPTVHAESYSPAVPVKPWSPAVPADPWEGYTPNEAQFPAQAHVQDPVGWNLPAN